MKIVKNGILAMAAAIILAFPFVAYSQDSSLTGSAISLVQDLGALESCASLGADVAGCLPLVDLVRDRVEGAESDLRRIEMKLEDLNRKSDLTLKKLDSIHNYLTLTHGNLEKRLDAIPAQTADRIHITSFAIDAHVLVKQVYSQKEYDLETVDDCKDELKELVLRSEAIAELRRAGEFHYMAGNIYLTCSLAKLFALEHQHHNKAIAKLDADFYTKNCNRLTSLYSAIKLRDVGVLEDDLKRKTSAAKSYLTNRGFKELLETTKRANVYITCHHPAVTKTERTLFSFQGFNRTEVIVITPEKNVSKEFVLENPLLTTVGNIPVLQPMHGLRESSPSNSNPTVIIQLPDNADFDVYVTETRSKYDEHARQVCDSAIQLSLARSVDLWKERAVNSLKAMNKFIESQESK